MQFNISVKYINIHTYIYISMKVSEYITRFLEINCIDTVFTITGGFAMHLNDPFQNHVLYVLPLDVRPQMR